MTALSHPEIYYKVARAAQTAIAIDSDPFDLLVCGGVNSMENVAVGGNE